LACIIEQYGDIVRSEWAFGKSREDSGFIVRPRGGGDVFSVGDVDRKSRVEMSGESVERLVCDRLNLVGRGAVDGTQIDPIRVQLQKKGIEGFDLGGCIVDPGYDEYLDEERVSGAASECEHAGFDRLDVDPAVPPVDPLETAGRGTIQGEFDGVDLAECFLDTGIVDGTAVAQYQGLDGAFEGVDAVDEFVQVGVEGRFAVGGKGEYIDIGVIGQGALDGRDDLVDRDDRCLHVHGLGRSQLAVETVVVALLGVGAEIDTEGFAETA